MKTFIIAEAGVNHNGSLDMAIQLIDAAASAGADAVKFQTFRAAQLASKVAPKAHYQTRTTSSAESQFDMLKKLELDEAAHLKLIAHAKTRGIEFLSTPFDSTTLDLLTGRLGLTTITVSSGDITNAPFLLEIARASQRVILSTGMCALSEVEAALGVLAFGFVAAVDAPPGPAAFDAAYASDAGQAALKARVAVLHCTTEYPAPIAEVNLRAVETLRAAFGLETGYSDHTVGIHIPIAAVARGSTIIEKHFTLNRELPGPDHKASLEPTELTAMVSAIRDIEVCLGDGIKRPTASESRNKIVARKSLVLARNVAAGEPLALACKRPGNGVSPYLYWQLSGTPANRQYAADEILDA